MRVVVHVRAFEPVAVERGEAIECLVDADLVVALADAQATGEVVHPQRAAEHGREATIDATATREHGDEEGEHAHEMRRVLEDSLPFREALVHQAELTLVEVPEPAVHELRAPRTGAGREVVPLDERGAQTAARGVERDARAGDATPHHQQVEVGAAQPLQRIAAIETRTTDGMGHCQRVSAAFPSNLRQLRGVRSSRTPDDACGARRVR